MLRLGTSADVPGIRALTRAAYGKWVAVIGREPLPMRADYEAAIRDHRFDLLCAGEELIGLIETVPDGRDLLIINVAVHPARQGQGHGGRLLRHAETLAEAAGASGLRLYTNARFAENIALYRRLGYAVEREEALNGGVAVHMRKPLVGEEEERPTA